MIKHTESFKRLKKEQQRILDFTLLVCYCVPNLKKSIKGHKEGIKNYETFVKPDYFIDDLNIGKLEGLSSDYKANLGKYTLISAFSFFETYIKDTVKELIEFHGGEDIFINNLHNRHKDYLLNQDIALKEEKSKLQEPLKKKDTQKYKKYINSLNLKPNYRNPSELLATFGLKYFVELVTGSGYKSVLIPDILEFGFGMDLSDKINKHPDYIQYDLRETFNIMRDLRNNIGHGNSNDIGFEKVMDLIRFLRYLSVKTDEHLVEHFFVLERYE